MGADDDVLLSEAELAKEQDAGGALAEPKDLPAAQAVVDPTEGKLIPDAARICPRCKKEASRIVSNMNGRQGYCGPCKFDWPIGPPVAAMALPIQGRNATGKQTIVPPDYGIVFEDFDPQGPK